MRLRLGILLIIGAFVFALGACGVPMAVYRDRDVGLTSRQVAMLKTDAWQDSRSSNWGELGLIFPVVRQVVEGEPGLYSDSYASGVVVWRTVFGIEYGRTQVRGDWADTDFHARPLMRAWLMFLVPELGMIGLASVLLFLEWRDGRAARKRRIALVESSEESLALSGLPEINGGDLARALGSSQDKKKEPDRHRGLRGRE